MRVRLWITVGVPAPRKGFDPAVSRLHVRACGRELQASCVGPGNGPFDLDKMQARRGNLLGTRLICQ